MPSFPLSYPAGKPGAGGAAAEAGHRVREHDGQWVVDADTPEEAAAAQAFLDAWDDVAVARARAKAAVKAEAGRRIEAFAPLWRQSNLIARGVELTDKRVAGTITPAEEAEAAALRSLFGRIKAIRAASDAIEAGLDDEGDAYALYGFDPAMADWPE